MIISLINLKGGVGKTTTALALATAAFLDGFQVKVYDADPQSSASLWAKTAKKYRDPLPFDVKSANLATVRALEKKRNDREEWIFIDCPPNGHIMDEAMAISDMVIVPTTSGPADMAKTLESVDTLEAQGIFYAVLLTRIRSRTISLRESLKELQKRNVSYFDTQIPSREALKSFYGNAFGDELFGYEQLWQEVKEGLIDAS